MTKLEFIAQSKEVLNYSDFSWLQKLYFWIVLPLAYSQYNNFTEQDN